MRTLSLDLETYSSVDLLKCGVYQYAADDDFEILLFAYSVDGGKVKVIDVAMGEKIPQEIVLALKDTKVEKWAFNAAFERVCLSNFLGEWLKPQGWHCSMVWAATLGLPMSLADVGEVLKLQNQKLKEGRDLIRYFCVPCKPTKTNGNRTRNFPSHDMERWNTFKEYNRRDVEVELDIHRKLSSFPVIQSEWENYWLDQEINDRGVMIDLELAKEAVTMDTRTKADCIYEAQEITGLENPNSPIQLKEWLATQGLTLESLDKVTVGDRIDNTTGNVRRLLELRQEMSRSSVKKYTAMLVAAGKDSRARGLIQFYGANRTGRFAGRLIQVQNLPRNMIPDLAEARQLVRDSNYTAIHALYDSPSDILSQLIRTAFIPKEGCRFIVADFSAIEARVLAWLAGEHWVLDVFRNKGDIYCATASRMFHCKVEKHGVNGDLRQKGKQATLSCIAEGELVLTDKGLIPIEKITLEHKVWDGESWVNHDGVIYRGEKEVIAYGGLRATADHMVYLQGESEPVQFGIAAASGAYLAETGNGRRAVRLGEDNISRETLECFNESLLCTDGMPGLRKYPMAEQRKSCKRAFKGMSALLSTNADTILVEESLNGCKGKVRKSKMQAVQKL